MCWLFISSSIDPSLFLFLMFEPCVLTVDEEALRRHWFLFFGPRGVDMSSVATEF